MTRHMLDSGEICRALETRLESVSGWTKKTLQWEAQPNFQIDVTYYIHKKNHIAIFPSPLAVSRPSGGTDSLEPVYAEVMAEFRKKYSATWKVGAILLGMGTTERHYVASFTDEGGNTRIFDSKITDPDRFLSSPQSPGLLQRLWGVLTAPFRSLAWLLGFGRQTSSERNMRGTTIHRTGHQPLWDGRSCGYHAGGILLALADNPELAPVNFQQQAMRSGHDETFETAMRPPPAHTAHPAGLYSKRPVNTLTTTIPTDPYTIGNTP